MVAKSALSTAFWSATRSLEVSFFCTIRQYRSACKEFCTHLRLLALLEERVLTRLASSLVLGEVAILADLLQNLSIHTLQINLGRSGDDISGIDPSEGNTVDFEGTSDEENTLGKVLKDDNTLATETTSEEDNDGTRLERLAGLCGTDGLAGLESQLAELQLRSLDHIDSFQSR